MKQLTAQCHAERTAVFHNYIGPIIASSFFENICYALAAGKPERGFETYNKPTSTFIPIIILVIPMYYGFAYLVIDLIYSFYLLFFFFFAFLLFFSCYLFFNYHILFNLS